MMKPKTCWLATSLIRDYADPTEPMKYPDKFTEFIEVEAIGRLCEELRLDTSCCYDTEDLIRLIKNQFDIQRESSDELKKSSQRYERLRVLGCAPYSSSHLERGLVMRFQNLDEFIDKDVENYPSRGEASLAFPSKR